MHRQAPAVVNSRPPYRTPGSRLVWSTVNEWLRDASVLAVRRISSQRHQQESAHLNTLAQHLDIIKQATDRELEVLRAYIGRQGYRPPQGMRAGTSWQAVLEAVNNELYVREQTEREIEDVQREFAAEALREE